LCVVEREHRTRHHPSPRVVSEAAQLIKFGRLGSTMKKHRFDAVLFKPAVVGQFHTGSDTARQVGIQAFLAQGIDNVRHCLSKEGLL
jgi:hypothetical protein